MISKKEIDKWDRAWRVSQRAQQAFLASTAASRAMEAASKHFNSMLSATKHLRPGFRVDIPPPKLVPPPSLLKEFENVQRFHNRIADELDKSLTALYSMTENSLARLDPIFSLGFRWQEFLSSIPEFSAISEHLQAASKFETLSAQSAYVRSILDDDEFEYGWFAVLPFVTLVELYKESKAGNEEDVKQAFIERFSDRETINELLEKFSRNKLFKPRIHIIRDAMNAHLAGSYTLSIPIILAQIDGIFIEEHEGLQGKLASYCPRCKYRKPMTLNARNICEYLVKRQSEYLVSFLKHVIETFATLRNDILHGKKIDYPDAHLSTKMLVSLLQLHCSTAKDHWP